jgi:hypothetical protein
MLEIKADEHTGTKNFNIFLNVKCKDSVLSKNTSINPIKKTSSGIDRIKKFKIKLPLKRNVYIRQQTVAIFW